ncbi:kremen protein 2-like [Branchiostoma lanceolatum]|uniref:kremen protein 2-like n=1 Tax=Branchiostoma lanceolatum TaxID=7740 RepID=UPI00345616B4
MKVYTCALLVVVLIAVAKESSAAANCKYVGCLVNPWDPPRFTTSLVNGAEMSIEMCIKHCRDKKQQYAGLKGIGCGCGTQADVDAMEKAWYEDECNYNCRAGGGECGGSRRVSVYSTNPAPCKGRRELEVLSELTDTLEKLENVFKREMGETGDFEEEMRELEDMEAADMFEDEE